jgi:TrmH family RNA methyltransferase
MTLAPKPITSLQNDRVKAIRALEMRKVRKETGLFVAEGAALLVTARGPVATLRWPALEVPMSIAHLIERAALA